MTYPVGQFATFPIPDDIGDFGSGAVTLMGPSDVFASLFEYGPESVGTALFARQGRPTGFSEADFSPMTLRRGIPGQSGTQWFFTEAGRPFSFYAVLGSHALRAALVPRVNTLLDVVDGEPRRVRPSRDEAPVELIGLYLIAAGLLVVAGAAKAARPDDTARAMAALLPGSPSLACCAAVVRAARWPRPRSAPSPSRFPRPATAVLVALSYLCFFGVVAYARRRGGPLATCGCFGRPDTPPTMLHLVLDLALAAAATVVALGAPSHGTLATQLAHQPWAGFPLLFVSAVGLWLTTLALSALAALTGARRLARPLPVPGAVSLSTALVARTARVLEGRLSRRSLINRSAFVGSAVAVGSGLDLALKPGTAYGAICECGNAGCGCGSTCCSGFSEFCCEVSGANYCPENTVMGGWWVADNSSYCGGPRYYMDCNATC